MTRWLVIFVFLIAAPAWAQPASQPTTPASALLTHNGVKGIWFPMPKARALLKDAKALPATKKVLDKTETRLGNEKERSALLAKQVGTSEEIAEAWKKTAKQQAEALAKKESFWRSPYLWVTVGFVVGAATTVGIAVAVKKSGATE
jgi:hypothetical protein